MTPRMPFRPPSWCCCGKPVNCGFTTRSGPGCTAWPGGWPFVPRCRCAGVVHSNAGRPRRERWSLPGQVAATGRRWSFTKKSTGFPSATVRPGRSLPPGGSKPRAGGQYVATAGGHAQEPVAPRRELLRGRLSRRGVDLPAGLLAAARISNGADAALKSSMLGSFLGVAARSGFDRAGQSGLISARTIHLVDEAIKTMFLTKMRIGMLAAVVVAGLAAGAGRGICQQGPSGKGGQARGQRGEPTASGPAGRPRLAVAGAVLYSPVAHHDHRTAGARARAWPRIGSSGRFERLPRRATPSGASPENRREDRWPHGPH